jgi:hypothetical protein
VAREEMQIADCGFLIAEWKDMEVVFQSAI